MPGIAKASVLKGFHRPLETVTYPVPDRVDPGAALVQTSMAGVCGTDVHLWKGELPIVLPVILGHETVGRIECLGDHLTRDWTGQDLRTGDRVTWNSARSCGNCFYCTRKGQPTRCPKRRAYGIGYRCDQPPHWLGGYAEHHYLLPGTTLFKLPDNLPDEAVIGAGCALITALHGVERLCAETPGPWRSGHEADPSGAAVPRLPELWQDHVVVQGAGPVGIAALVVAREAGARQITVIGAPAARLELARRFGADVTLNLEDMPEAKDRIQAVLDRTSGHGADVVIECVGEPVVLEEGIAMCRDGAKYLVLGHYCDAGPTTFNPHLVTRKQLQVHGSWSSEPRHLQRSLKLLAARRDRYPFETMVTHRFPVTEASEALATTARWESAKSVIVPS